MYDIRQIDLSEPSLQSYHRLLTEVFPTAAAQFTPAYLTWQYVRNPAGPAVGFNAFSGETLAAHYVTLPIRVQLDGRACKGLLSLNTATHPQHQGKGLFTKLADATYQYAASQGYELVVGVANANSTPGFTRKLGFQLVSPLEARLGVGALPSQDPRFTSEFEVLWDRELLAWRLANPSRAYRLRPRGDSVRVEAPHGQGRHPGHPRRLPAAARPHVPGAHRALQPQPGAAVAGHRPEPPLPALALPAHPGAAAALAAEPHLPGPVRQASEPGRVAPALPCARFRCLLRHRRPAPPPWDREWGGAVPRRACCLSFGLTGLFGWWAFHDLRWGDMWASLRTANFLWLVPHVVLLQCVHWLRALRWGSLLSGLERVPFRVLNEATAVGNMLFVLLPLRLGEFARPVLISRRSSIRASAALTSVVLERIIDGVAVALLLEGTLWWLGDATETLRYLRWGTHLMLAAFLGLWAVLLLAYWQRALAVRWVRLGLGRVSPGLAERVAGLMDSFVGAVRQVSGPRQFFSAVVMTVAIWVVNGLAILVLAYAFDCAGETDACVPLRLDVFQSFVVMGVTVLGG